MRLEGINLKIRLFQTEYKNFFMGKRMLIGGKAVTDCELDVNVGEIRLKEAPKPKVEENKTEEKKSKENPCSRLSSPL